MSLDDYDTTVDGADLLDRVETFLGRFVAYPSEHARVAHTLWVAHTHLMGAWDSTPRIAFLSPEPGSGKTRALEITELLVPLPVMAINVTPAYLFRKVSDDVGAPTILYDEIDTVFGPKAKDNEDIRGLLNAGHRRGASAGRCVVHGKRVETEELPAYCAVAMAGLGGLPDTILTRSVIVKMARRKGDEKVEPFRPRVHEADGHALRDELAAWAVSIRGAVDGVWPDMPKGIEDRNADVWEALLAVADAVDPVAGEGPDVTDAAAGVAGVTASGWANRARVAAVTLVADLQDHTASLGVRLLDDLRAVFLEHDRAADSTTYLLTKLRGMEDGPWGDMRGKPLDPRGLSKRLRQYGIKPVNVRIEDSVLKGYKRADLQDAWARYLPPLPPHKSATPAAPLQGEVLAEIKPIRPVDGWDDPYCTQCLQPRLVDGDDNPLCEKCRMGQAAAERTAAATYF